ncbi:hypothetical protein EZ449_00425 [Pedobacter frigidisoli]|uniref:Outer membrane protein beta-barrel family protein n=1 Tax=Pedobacter frigidisoli TaxID=2530455 RepID=A0A4R0P6J2_9SPHI|nr:TonB-dependent receptor [Pedobacter frigidisoli]TCD12550.1 hypothetical protein EZ449_00425 [Pedobacter frigidisoli]
MLNFLKIVLALAFVITVNTASAQQSKPILPGATKGILRDTAHNYVLKSATVSVYKLADSSLVSYQISNNYGEFSFKNLPVGVSLRLDVSHVAYQTLRKKFTIPNDKNFIDLGTLIINPKDNTLDEVTVTIPPITMNGDTLEFNAAAFKLDSNAVVEDLLRKIPNVTLWGDGQITVNGRVVKSVLVNGKPFFGGDAKVATQNIAKNALEKIQVYNTVKDKNNPLDSTLTVNLKLKKGKELGYFGKVGGGYGTDHRYEADASFNVFSPKMQLAIVGASNNINKSLNNVNTLINNSTFKGVGTNVEYQPDFRASGINQPNAGGVKFTYNFVEKPSWENKNTVTSSYFIQNTNNDFVSNSETTTSINTTDKIYEQNTNTSSNINNNQNFDAKYELTKKNKALTISHNLSRNKGENTNETFRNALNTQNVLTSTNNTFNQSSFDNSRFNFQVDFRLSQNYMKPKRIKGVNISYAITVNDNENNRSNLTDFTSFTNAASNRRFDRRYETKYNSVYQQINLELPNLKSLFFGKSELGGIDFQLSNSLNLNNRKDDNQVQDLNTIANSYLNNAYLSNHVETNFIEETPGLTITKSFYKSLSNRYNKNLTLNFAPKQKLIHQENKSQRSFQNITRNYQRFMPDASINYSDNQYGEYYKSYSVNFNTKVRLPSIDQLAPLTDSTNLYSLQRGNINLREAVDREISLSINHYDQTNKNTLNYNLSMTAGFTNDQIVDSTFIDDQNRRTNFLTNADGNRYLNFYGDARKAFKFKTSELQINLNSQISNTKTPGYTNSLFAFSKNFTTNTGLTVNYTYKSYLALAIGQTYGTYRSKQEAFNTEYSGVNKASTLSSSYNITKKFTLNTNISFNQSSSSNADDINFTIWNASAIYRFLKGNNAEFKLSALDIHHQNTSIINYGSGNSFTVGSRNVLQQYFMATFSYYPRQFGKKAAVKK